MASFKEAFAAARKAQGAGGEFTWNGKSYSTNIAGETGKKKKPAFSTDMANKAINKAAGVQTPDASTPRPQKRPVDMTPKPVAAPASVTVSKLSRTPDTSVAGRLGAALGSYVGKQIAGPSKLDNLKSDAADQTNRSTANQGMKELMTGRKGAAAQYKKGGMMKEGSAKDTREDKAKAKKAGMSMAEWEKSPADVKHDTGMKKGGTVKKMAMGGTVRGAGAAIRGKRFTGSC